MGAVVWPRTTGHRYCSAQLHISRKSACADHPILYHLSGLFLSATANLSSSVLTQQAPGFLSGLFCSFLFFWCHYSFFLFFPVTFTFFRHDVSPDNRLVIINLLTPTIAPGCYDAV
jgi:hypothetical protein